MNETLSFEKLKDYVLKCIEKLFLRYKEDSDFNLNYESNFHADLYVLLNIEDLRFWQSDSVEMGTKENFHGIDLRVYNPDNEDEYIDINIKLEERENEKIENDLKMLNDEKSKFPIFLYIEYDPSHYDRYSKGKLKQWQKENPSIEIIFINPKKIINLKKSVM